jgi:hypothetical protein
MQLNSRVSAVCKREIRAGRCGKGCELYTVCVVKNSSLGVVNLADWVRGVNRFMGGLSADFGFVEEE